MIIVISGQAGSGKDTAADFIVEKFGFVKVGLADILKRICKEIFDFSDERLYGPSEKRGEPDTRYLRGKDYLSSRLALITLGQAGRDCYESVWADYALRISKILIEDKSVMYTQQEGLVQRVEQTSMGEWKRDDAPKGIIPGVVISDGRYFDEIMTFKKENAFLIRIIRSNLPYNKYAGHLSESGQSEIPDNIFDEVVMNDGSKEDLYAEITKIMQEKLGFGH